MFLAISPIKEQFLVGRVLGITVLHGFAKRLQCALYIADRLINGGQEGMSHAVSGFRLENNIQYVQRVVYPIFTVKDFSPFEQLVEIFQFRPSHMKVLSSWIQRSLSGWEQTEGMRPPLFVRTFCNTN